MFCLPAIPYCMQPQAKSKSKSKANANANTNDDDDGYSNDGDEFQDSGSVDHTNDDEYDDGFDEGKVLNSGQWALSQSHPTANVEFAFIFGQLHVQHSLREIAANANSLHEEGCCTFFLCKDARVCPKLFERERERESCGFPHNLICCPWMNH